MAIGLTLYIYAEIICKGAVLAHIDNQKLLFGAMIFTVWQLVMLAIGTGVALLIERLYDTEQMQQFTWIASIFIFAMLAAKMIIKGWKNEPIEERREDVLIRKNVILFSSKIGIQTGLMGLVLGFLGINFVTAVIVFAIAAIIVFILGLYSGYRLGYVYKTTAYIAGSLFFIMSDIYLVGCFLRGIP
jgi:putative Mn2+ efflux pump MntP